MRAWNCLTPVFFLSGIMSLFNAESLNPPHPSNNLIIATTSYQPIKHASTHSNTLTHQPNMMTAGYICSVRILKCLRIRRARRELETCRLRTWRKFAGLSSLRWALFLTRVESRWKLTKRWRWKSRVSVCETQFLTSSVNTSEVWWAVSQWGWLQ